MTVEALDASCWLNTVWIDVIPTHGTRAIDLQTQIHIYYISNVYSTQVFRPAKPLFVTYSAFDWHQKQ